MDSKAFIVLRTTVIVPLYLLLLLLNCSFDVLECCAAPLLAVARRFEVLGLFDLCEEHLIDSLVPSTAADTYLFASTVGAFRLKYACLCIMALNLHEAVNSKNFILLDGDTCRQLLELSLIPKEAVLVRVQEIGLKARDGCKDALLPNDGEDKGEDVLVSDGLLSNIPAYLHLIL
jgi:hypothetical protein